MQKFKKRLGSDITGEKGITKIRQFCDENGFLFQGEPRKDFGIDCYIEVVLEDRPTNFLIGIQSKSGESYQKGENDEGFYIYFSEADIEYWLASNIPVFVLFYNEQDNKVYLKHVQYYCSQIKLPINDVKKIYFDKDSDQANEKIAVYIRTLVLSTPSEVNRLNIVSCKFPQIILPNKSTYLTNEELKTNMITSVNITDYFKPEDDNYTYNIQGESFILGYSSNLEWVARVTVVDLGSKCTTYGMTFINLNRWSSLYLPIYEEKDYDDGFISSVEMENRLSKIQKLIEKLLIRPAFKGI